MNHSRECPLERLAHDWYYLRSDEESGRQDWGGQRFRYAEQAPAGVWSAREFHRRMATFWIQEYRLDGFRLDDFADINNWDFVQAFRDHSWQVQQDTFGDRPFIVIAEDSNRRAVITQDAPPNPGGHKTVDAVWNFSYQQDVRLLLRDQLATSGPILRRQRVEAAIAGTGVWDGLGNQLQPGFADLAQAVDYLTSHDVQQVDAQRLMSVMVSDAFSLWGQTNPIASVRFLVDTLGRLPDPPLAYLTALDRVRAAFVLLLTSVGIPMFLAGEEFGDVHDIDPGDWRLKMSDPVDWERAKPELYPAHGELQARVADLIALRATRAALQRDEIDFFHYHPTFDDWNGERVFAYCRTGGAPRGAAGQVVVVANCGPADYGGGYQLPWSWAGVGQEHGAPLRAEAAATVAGGRATVPLLPFDARVFTP